MKSKYIFLIIFVVGVTNLFADSNINEEFQKALNNPFKYYKTGEFQKYFQLIKNGSSPDISKSVQDSISTVITNLDSSKNPSKYFIYQMLNFSTKKDNINSDQIDQLMDFTITTLHDPDASENLLKMISNLNSFDVSRQLNKLINYKKNNSAIISLLNHNYLKMTDKEKKQYIKKLQKSSKSCTDNDLVIESYRRIANISFKFENYKKSRKYYNKVLKVCDDKLRNSISVRLKICNKYILRDNSKTFIIIIYTTVILTLLFRIIMGSGFDVRYFFKTSVIWLLIYVAIFICVALIFSKTPETGTMVKINKLVEPILYFNFFDMQAGQIIQYLIIGFLPLVYVIIYQSIKHKMSYLVLSITMLFLSIAVWTNIGLVNIYDDKMNMNGVYEKGVFYFQGKIDDAVSRKPEQFLKKINKLPKDERQSLKDLLDKHK